MSCHHDGNMDLRDVFRACDETILSLRKEDPTGTKFGYAYPYLAAMREAHRQYGADGVRTQALYILNNLQTWRGPLARATKGFFKSFGTVKCFAIFPRAARTFTLAGGALINSEME